MSQPNDKYFEKHKDYYSEHMIEYKPQNWLASEVPVARWKLLLTIGLLIVLGMTTREQDAFTKVLVEVSSFKSGILALLGIFLLTRRR